MLVKGEKSKMHYTEPKQGKPLLPGEIFDGDWIITKDGRTLQAFEDNQETEEINYDQFFANTERFATEEEIRKELRRNRIMPPLILSAANPEGMTRENFFNELHQYYPVPVNEFYSWLFLYFSKAHQLPFQKHQVKLSLNKQIATRIESAITFFELFPVAMQVGILIEFTNDSNPNYSLMDAAMTYTDTMNTMQDYVITIQYWFKQTAKLQKEEHKLTEDEIHD